MINLKVKVERSDLTRLNEILPILFDQVKEILTVSEWLHYYNFRSLSKKVFDKCFSITWKKTKSVTLSININEFNSLMLIKSMNEVFLSQEKFLYYKILLEQIIGNLDKQTTELISSKGFTDTIE